MENLEQRLYGLHAPMPAGLVGSAIAGAAAGGASHLAGRRSRRWLRRPPAIVATALVVIVVVNVIAVYFVPVYGTAIASAPLLSSVSVPVLKYIGVDPTAVNSVADVAVANGHKLRLVGAYADPVRTLALVEIDDQQLAIPTKSTRTYHLDAYLTDQFGRTYHSVYSAGLGAEFEPLQPPATSTGARLTLHVMHLLPTLPSDREVGGNWELHFTLTQALGRALPMPQPIQRGDTTYVFTSAQLSGQLLKVRWLVSGGANARIHALIDSYDPAHPMPVDVQDQYRHLMEDYFWPVVEDANGMRVEIRDFGTTFPKGKPAEGEWNGVLPRPGRYTIGFGKDIRMETRVFVVN